MSTAEDTVRTITHDDCTSVGDFKFVAEASSLGWPVGKVPRTIPTDMGNRQPFVYERHETRDGEVVAWQYRQPFGIIRLRVFND